MKKGLFILLFLMLFPAVVMAAGVSVSPSKLSTKPNGKVSFTISANSAAGRVDISSSDTSVATVSKSSVWLDNDKQTITVTGKKDGTATISVKLSDVATYSGANISGTTYNVTVTVKTPVADTRSTNNSLGSLAVDGYEVVKVDDNNYTLTVANNVTSVNVNATAADSKASVTGTGSHDLSVGDNNIQIVVTAENGSKNTINLYVTRKDSYYLEDLDYLLGTDTNDINITIAADTVIPAATLEKIKDSGKTVNFNYYNSNKVLVYSWIAYGTKLDNISDLLTTITYDTDEKKDILKLSNYADGLFIKLKQEKYAISGLKIKIFANSKFDNDDITKVYTYVKGNDKLALVKDDLTVKDGYVEIDPSDVDDYFVTMSTISMAESKIETGKKSSVVIYIIIIVILVLVIIGLVIALIFKNKEVTSKKVAHKVKPNQLEADK